MAEKKKKSKKTGPRPAVRRGPLPSVASPGDITPSPAPAFTDQSKRTQGAVETRMGIAGRAAYGYPIKMSDAVETRVKYLEDAVSRSPSGVPAGGRWYAEHQQDVQKVTESANTEATEPVSVGRMINATGPLSIRNKPTHELKAARSAGWIAAHPEETVDITGDMAEATIGIGGAKHGVTEGTHKLRNLSSVQIALLGRAETDVVRGTGQERALNRGVTSATLDSSGRLAAARAIDLTRGANFDKVIKDGPKIHNYVAQTHLANEPEASYNNEVFWRRSNSPVFTEGGQHEMGPHMSGDKNSPYWRQGHLLSASEMSGFNPDGAPNISVEDYIGHAMSAEVASRRGKKGRRAREAQDIVNVTKGKKGTLPADFSPGEMAHSFHEEATRRAAQKFAATSLTNEGTVTEAPTMVGTQAMAWTEWQAQHNPPRAAKTPRQSKPPEQLTLDGF